MLFTLNQMAATFAATADCIDDALYFAGFSPVEYDETGDHVYDLDAFRHLALLNQADQEQQHELELEARDESSTTMRTVSNPPQQARAWM